MPGRVDCREMPTGTVHAMTSRTTRRFGLLAAGAGARSCCLSRAAATGTPSRSRVQAALVTSGLPQTEARCATKQLFTVLSRSQLRNLAESGSGALDDKATTALSTALATCVPERQRVGQLAHHRVVDAHDPATDRTVRLQALTRRARILASTRGPLRRLSRGRASAAWSTVLPRRLRRSPSAQFRRHAPTSGPVSAGLAEAWARSRAEYQSVVASSASDATSCWRRAANFWDDSPSAGHTGRPNVTTVRPGRMVLDPRGRMRPVPCRCTGTTGTPQRMAR